MWWTFAAMAEQPMQAKSLKGKWPRLKGSWIKEYAGNKRFYADLCRAVYGGQHKNCTISHKNALIEARDSERMDIEAWLVSVEVNTGECGEPLPVPTGERL
jgi:hypothetical protein